MKFIERTLMMNQEKFSNEAQEEVVLIPKPRRIEINGTRPARAYGLFDTKTGTQVKYFVKGNGGQIEFNDLDPNMHYDVGVIEDRGDVKPIFAINWSAAMRDVTDEILNNSNDLPIQYPTTYKVIFKDNNSNGIYDLVDDNGDTVGQVAQLSPLGDKPYFQMIYSMRMKDDTIK